MSNKIKDKKLSDSLYDIRDALDNLEKRCLELEEENAMLTSELESNEAEIEGLGSTISSLEEEAEEYREKVAQLEVAIAEAYLTDTKPE